MKKLSAKFHLSMGLTSIVMTLLLLATMLNMIPDREQAALAGRVALAESIASSSTLFLSKKDYSSITSNIEFALSRNDDLQAVALKREEDEKPVIFGDESAIDFSSQSDTSSPSELLLPILQGDKQWGQIRLIYTDLSGVGWWQKIRNSRLTLIAFCSLVGFALFYLYLGKALKALNPSQAVPGRVRSALDTLAEALIVIDGKSNVVLANKAFQSITGETAESVLGKKADQFKWHLNDLHPDEAQADEDRIFPWQEALESAETIRGARLWLEADNGHWHKFQVNCSPILTGKKASGVLILSLIHI